MKEKKSEGGKGRVEIDISVKNKKNTRKKLLLIGGEKRRRERREKGRGWYCKVPRNLIIGSDS